MTDTVLCCTDQPPRSQPATVFNPPTLRITLSFPDTARVASLDIEVTDEGPVSPDYIGQVITAALAASNINPLRAGNGTASALLAQIRQEART